MKIPSPALHCAPAPQPSTTHSFPFVTIPTSPGVAPVEVCLVARLSPGSGDRLFYSVRARQRSHGEYVDALDEPSAKLGSTDFANGDPTSLYSFGVGPAGHPFHRHAGHRVFTAIAGSTGAQLRFSTATPDDIGDDPASFERALHLVNIPADCLFTVRFGGETWHQFAPADTTSRHPAFFALSCHTNELGGLLSDEVKARVLADQADIPTLTQLLPEAVLALLRKEPVDWRRARTTVLYLDNAPGSALDVACTGTRAALGTVCGAWTRQRPTPGYVVAPQARGRVVEARTLPMDSLLRRHLSGVHVHHEDHFSLLLTRNDLLSPQANAEALLAELLAGFINNPPEGVTQLMHLRNKLVGPLKLRTSSLGCPVSSLLSDEPCNRFAGRYPVLDQDIDDGGVVAQVILGADDKHLVFRSCAAVRIYPNGGVEFSLSTRVACKNLFGQFYMAAISKTHRTYVTPSMLENAVNFLRS